MRCGISFLRWKDGVSMTVIELHDFFCFFCFSVICPLWMNGITAAASKQGLQCFIKIATGVH